MSPQESCVLVTQTLQYNSNTNLSKRIGSQLTIKKIILDYPVGPKQSQEPVKPEEEGKSASQDSA